MSVGDPDPIKVAFDAASERLAQSGFANLDKVDQIVVTVWWLVGEVNNGGFDQYYFNSSGDHAFFAPEALKAIGAVETAAIVSRANAVFGPDGPSPARATRQEQLLAIRGPGEDDEPGPWDALDDEFYAWPENLFVLLTAFLKR